MQSFHPARNYFAKSSECVDCSVDIDSSNVAMLSKLGSSWGGGVHVLGSGKRKHSEFAEENAALRSGPTSLKELFQWARRHARDYMQDRDRTLRLLKHLQLGVDLCSHYSGMRTAETGFRVFIDELLRQAKDASWVPPDFEIKLHSSYGCDRDAACLLCTSASSPHSPEHFHAEMEGRLKPEVKTN